MVEEVLQKQHEIEICQITDYLENYLLNNDIESYQRLTRSYIKEWVKKHHNNI